MSFSAIAIKSVQTPPVVLTMLVDGPIVSVPWEVVTVVVPLSLIHASLVLIVSLYLLGCPSTVIFLV